jgi:hypothetical protein
MNRPLAKVLACNLVEEDAEEVPILGQSFQFAISPFQVRSFRLLPA